MSWESSAWALNVPLGGTKKVVLIGLASHAHADGTEAWPAVETLMRYANCDRRTVQRTLRWLEDDGWIEPMGTHAINGREDRRTIRYRLVLERGGANAASSDGATSRDGAASMVERGGTGVANGAAPTPPEPSIEPSRNSPERESARARVRDSVPEKPPDDFPDELRPHARAVLPLLRSIAVEHHAKAVSTRALAITMMGRPRKPLVKVALDLAAWSVDSKRTIRDVVATYRTWLDRTDDLASTEVLDEQGRPQGRVPGSAGGIIGGQPISRAQRQENEQIEMLQRLHREAKEGKWG